MNCDSSISTKCEIKTRRLGKTTYDRPELTLTDTLQTNAAMQEKLQNYVRVDDVDDIPLRTHVRYVTLKDGKQRFCLGGLLTKKHSKYVVLSNGTFSWSVQRYHWSEEDQENPAFETAFFRILSKNEQQNKQWEQKESEIEKLKQYIRENHNQ